MDWTEQNMNLEPAKLPVLPIIAELKMHKARLNHEDF